MGLGLDVFRCSICHKFEWAQQQSFAQRNWYVQDLTYADPKGKAHYINRWFHLTHHPHYGTNVSPSTHIHGLMGLPCFQLPEEGLTRPAPTPELA